MGHTLSGNAQYKTDCGTHNSGRHIGLVRAAPVSHGIMNREEHPWKYNSVMKWRQDFAG